MKISKHFSLAATVLMLNAIAVQANNPSADFEISAGAEQDSNLNVIELDKNSHESDTALLLNAKADANWKPAEKFSLSGGYAYSGKSYQHNSNYDLAIHQLYVDGNYNFDALTLGASHHFADAQLDGKEFLDLHQSSLYISKLINDKIYLRAAGNWQEKIFSGLKDRNATNQGLSGDAFVFFNQGKTFISAGVASEKENASAQPFDYQGNSIKARVSHKFSAWNKDNKVQLGWRYVQRDYSHITPELKAERYDSSHAIDASWEVSLTPKVSLESKIEHGKYNSNLAAADYTENRASLLVKVRF